MKPLIVLVACLSSVFFSATALSANQEPTSVIANQQIKLEVEMALAPVKTPNDLITYMASHNTDSPLNQLTPMNRERFIQSLAFNNSGVSSFNYSALSDLNPTQVYQVLSIFGAQSLTTDTLRRNGAQMRSMGTISPMLAPLMEYRCAGGHTCMKDANAACTEHC